MQWLAKNADEPISLNIDKYRARQKQITSTITQNSSLLKLTEDMNVSAMEVDKDIFYNNPDKPKGERYQAWLKFIKTDMHIDKSVKIVDAIVQSQVQTVLK